MTRMKLFYIDKDGTCYRTVEFNGDGYCTKPVIMVGLDYSI